MTPPLPPSYGAPSLPVEEDPRAAGRSYLEVADGHEKTALAIELAIHGATFEPLVRQTAVALMSGLPLVRGSTPAQHVERLERLHAFVRDSVPYQNEPVEMFQPPTVTLTEGGDCDDHVILLGALAWSLRYPFAIEPSGDPADPFHYTIALGYPPADLPSGDASTTWLAAETTIPAELGELLEAAQGRTQR